MTSPRDERDQNDLERAAAETREPGEAARIRAEDDAETRARQADAGRELREAERTLRDTGRRLHADGDAAGAIERDVERTRDLTREVAERARELR
ncbi:MAG: hypothetical protein HOQ34_13840, partial [Gemmatimonadaceae bacterium]|nr:hypothetical protein [Gemmatimonadaceae bacterium]